MAVYDIQQFPANRLRYFNNQFLSDQDFIDDQRAQIARDRAQTRALCVAGVCEGLAVTYPDPRKAPVVGKGTAIDATGKLIVVVDDSSNIAMSDTLPSGLADGDYWLHISFADVEDANANTGKGTQTFTR